MPARSLRTPSYRLHKPTGQAVVTLDGRDFYLGKHGTPASRAEYDRLIAEWLANGRAAPRPPVPPTARTSRSTSCSWPSSAAPRPTTARAAEPPGRSRTSGTRSAHSGELYGHTAGPGLRPLAAEGGPSGDHRVRPLPQRGQPAGPDHRPGLQVGRRRRSMVPPSVHHGLKAVAGLRKGPLRRPGVRAGPAGPRGVRGRHPAPRLPAGLGDGRAAAAHRHAAGRGLHDADGRPRHVGPGLGLYPRIAQDGAPRAGAADLPRPPGPGGPPALAPARPGGLPVLAPPRPRRSEHAAMRAGAGRSKVRR